jgi:hypothetical protein
MAFHILPDFFSNDNLVFQYRALVLRGNSQEARHNLALRLTCEHITALAEQGVRS